MALSSSQWEIIGRICSQCWCSSKLSCLILHFFYYMLMTFFMTLSVISIHLICGNNWSQLLKLNLTCKTVWTGAGHGRIFLQNLLKQNLWLGKGFFMITCSFISTKCIRELRGSCIIVHSRHIGFVRGRGGGTCIRVRTIKMAWTIK